ncbi:MAG: type III pantothenate kinase [Gemmatimonadetes bacterium]|nr:type III pantothenate kinase [Gemmatimonadota bacterium]MBM4190697.1 type III pantothenate kinase [Gemmatimonadota bacterium]
MLLVADVGNTETTLGLCVDGAVRHHWRVTTEAARTPDEVHLLLHGLLGTAGIDARQLAGGAVGSVVPSVTGTLAESMARLIGKGPVIIDARSPLGITLAVDEPMTVGADRVINTLAASRLYGVDCVVVDLGTATTYDCVTADGVFLGGVIQPGIRTSAETLFRRTAKLAATELVAPAKVIGTRTDECIRSGVIYGAAESVDGVVRRIKREWPRPGVPKVVATGGLAALIQPHSAEIELTEPDLTLIGLCMAHGILAG